MDVCHPVGTADTNLVHHWLVRGLPVRYKHFFGTTAAMERPDRNLTSVLATLLQVVVGAKAPGSKREGAMVE